MKSLRARLVLCVLLIAALVMAGGPVGAQTDNVSSGGAETATGGLAGAEEVVGKATDQSFRDGPNGTVFTLTEIETLDGRSITVSTHGGIRSDGMGQYTSHEPQFTVGASYRMEVLEAIDGAPLDSSRAAATPRLYRIVGGDEGLARVSDDGLTAIDESDNTPFNYVLNPYNWAWTLPDNPPVIKVNPNTGDVNNEVALIQTALDVWEDDPGSAMDWTYGGTTSVTTVGDDGTNAVFWADTPDPVDGFLARTTTFYNPSNGRAVSTDTLFNNDYNWSDGAVSGAFDIPTVAIHESGHSLGLAHAPNSAAIMYFSLSSNTTKRVLSLGDRGGVAAHYPQVTTGESVAGRVTFSDGASASGVAVDLFTENRTRYLDSAVTNGSGDFSLDLAGPGCYVATFVAPAGVSFVATGNGYQNRAFCANANQTVTGIDAVLVAPGSETTSHGRVTFTDGSGAAGVELDLFTENRQSYLSTATTDGAGNYDLNLRGTGCYVTTFVAPSGTTFTDSGNGYLNRSFCATEGQAVTGVDAILVAAAAQATIGGRISGPGGGDESGVQVVFYRAAGDGSRGQFLGDATSNAGGRYQFTAQGGCFVIDFVAPTGRTWAATNGQYLQLSTCVAAGQADNTINAVLN